MKSTSIILFTVIIVNLSLSLNAQVQNSDCLEQISISIRSIDPVDEDFTDFNFLKKELRKADIVLLGEQGHGDGSTYQAKSRMVKFLHQEMDFDVLVFESSILDCHIAWTDIKRGLDPQESFGKGVFKFWAVSKYTTELIRYLGEKANTGDPLQLAGFDMQFSGMMSLKDRANVILAFLEKGPAAVQINKLPHIEEFLNNPYRFFKPKAKLDVDSVYREALASEMNMVSTLWEEKPWEMDQAPVSRFFANTPELMRFIWNLDLNNIDPDIANIRDRVMAENLIWLKETLYPGKKLVVWGANSHFGYNRDLLEPGDNMMPMGHYLKDNYGEKSYTMAFTSFDGESGSIMRDTIMNLPPASPECIESMLNKSGYDYAYLSLGSKKSKKCLNQAFKARIYGFADFTGQWSQMADGLFFINTMKPNIAGK